MADEKLSALTELAAAPATDDELYIRDISEASANMSKRITVGNLLQTIDVGSGNLTVQTTGAGKGLEVIGANSGTGGAKLELYHNSASAGTTDASSINIQANGGGGKHQYAVIAFRTVNVGDGTEEVELRYEGSVSGSLNLAMKVSGAGVVGGDLAYNEFDDWDDKAVVLQENVIPEMRESTIAKAFEEMGIAEKIDGRIESNGYMLNLQHGFWFNFHAIKRAYEEIDFLTDRINKLEAVNG